MIDRTYKNKFAEKKTYSVSSATLDVDIFDGTDAIEIFNIPEKSIVTRVFVIAESAGQSALRLAVDIGDTTVIAAADVDTLGDVTKVDTDMITGTGKVVTVTPSVKVTSGQFVVIVEFVEYTLGSGRLTNYS